MAPHSYRPPILAVFYALIAGLTLLTAIGAAAMILFSGDPDTRGILIRGAAIMLAGLAASAMLFGIAQVFNQLGLCTHYLSRICDSLEVQHARHRPHPSSQSISSSASAMPRILDLASSSVASCPNCMAELDVAALRKGRNRCPSCAVEFLAA